MLLVVASPVVAAALLLASPALPTKSTPSDVHNRGAKSPEADHTKPASTFTAASQQACLEAAAELGKPISADVASLRLVLDFILAEYPNDQGVFETRPQPKPVAGKPVPELDWLVALSELQPPSALATAHAEAIRVTTALRRLSATRSYDKKCEAAKILLNFAFHGVGSVFRDEVGRQIRAMESAALPALIRVALSETTTGKAEKRYANYQLDRMDRQRPQTVLAQVHDDPLRAEILRAYGQSRPQSAVSAVLGECDSPSARVRRTARWAWMQYVTKKPPEPPKRKLKLTGGKESEEEKQLYLTYRELADLEIRKQFPVWMNEPADPQKNLAELTQQLFDTLDANRAARWDAELGAAEVARKAGKLDEAVRIYDWILANDPLYARRLEMVPGYLAYAAARMTAKDWKAASMVFRKVAWLSNGALSKNVRPQALLAHALAGDRDVLPTAQALHPNHPELQAAAKDLRMQRWRNWWRRSGWPVGLGVLLFAGAFALWPRQRKRT